MTTWSAKMATCESQSPAWKQNEVSKVTAADTSSEKALPQEQLQLISGLYSEEFFVPDRGMACHGAWPLNFYRLVLLQRRRSLCQCTFMDRSERKHFCDELIVVVLDKANKELRYLRERDLWLEERHDERQAERFRLAVQLEDRVAAQELTFAS